MKYTTLWLCAALLLMMPMAWADLEIDVTSVTVNGDDYDGTTPVNVSPGDEVTIEFEYSNTGPGTLGHVIAFADELVDLEGYLEGLPSTEDCDGADCPTGTWYMGEGDVVSTEITFTVRADIPPAMDSFGVELGVACDIFCSDADGDSLIVSFDLVREDVGVIIVDESVDANEEEIDEDLTCETASVELEFDIVNTGSTDVEPELLVYNQLPSESSFDTEDGEFNSFTVSPVVRIEDITLDIISPGEFRTESIDVDISALSAGTHHLYFYLVNPYFDDEFFIGDRDEISFTLSNCLSSFSPAASSVSLEAGEEESFSVTADPSVEVTWTATRTSTSTVVSTGSGETFTFSQDTAGTYEVTAEVTAAEESHTWTVSVAAPPTPVPAGLSISTISFDNVQTGDVVNVTVTITNTGTTDSISDLTVMLEGVNPRYLARIVGTLPATLDAGESADLTLEITVPTDESSGTHSIGTFLVSGSNEDGDVLTATQTITLNPKSFLSIEQVELNGKTTGDLTLEEANEFDVEVKNEYTEDMEDITITVTILDVDGDDLEEESDSFDLDEGKDDTFTFSFDLSGENVEESQYTVEIVVEGEATDGTEHRTVQTMTVDVERENHQVIVQKATLGSSTLQCTRQTSLQVIVENIGESNEDDVEIRVKNVQLGIDLSKDGVELDKFSGNDNEFRTTFNLNFEDAVSGSHTLTVEVYRDGSIDDTEEVIVQISPCSTSSSTSGQNQVQAGDDDLAVELERQLQARQQQEGQKVTSSFRDGDSYTLFLGILAVLMFIAVVMAIMVLLVKKK